MFQGAVKASQEKNMNVYRTGKKHGTWKSDELGKSPLQQLLSLTGSYEGAITTPGLSCGSCYCQGIRLTR